MSRHVAQQRRLPDGVPWNSGEWEIVLSSVKELLLALNVLAGLDTP